MKPFAPARIVGGSVVAEREPFAFEALASYRAVEVTEIATPSPYREPPRLALDRVVVQEPHAYVTGDEHFLALFQRAVLETAALAGTCAPRLLHTFGRGDTVRAIVMEHVDGVTIEQVLDVLRRQRAVLPVEIALAIAAELVSLWRIPIDRGSPIRFHLGIGDVWIAPDGRVRAKPELVELRARQTVGAAVHIFEGNIAYISPEQVAGDDLRLESGMFTLGLLLFELLANAHPFTSDEDSMFQLLARMHGEAAPPIASRRGVPRPVAAFVDRALTREPTGRWPSWAALAAELAQVRAALPPAGPDQILRALPIRPEPEPAIDPMLLGGWRALPNDGHVVVRARGHGTHAPPPARARVRLDEDLVYGGRDRRPMLAAGPLLVDVRPVTAAEFQRFVLAVVGPEALAFDADDTPQTGVSYEQAAAYAAWAGKRLPTEAEWIEAVTALGAARLGTGEVWEWTATPAQREGWIVRGGRWRDEAARPPSPDNRSFETGPAGDLGFRCVCDRSDPAPRLR